MLERQVFWFGAPLRHAEKERELVRTWYTSAFTVEFLALFQRFVRLLLLHFGRRYINVTLAAVALALYCVDALLLSKYPVHLVSSLL